MISEAQADAAVAERAKFLAQPENRALEVVTESGVIIEIRDKVLPLGGTVIIFTDITTQRAAERKLREAHKMDAIGQLTGGIAHDFNNLLTVITANLGLLDIRFHDDADAGKWLRTALRASERGSRLTRRLLSFARQQHLEPKQLVVNELIQDSVEMLGRTLGESIDIHHHLDPDLPPAVIDPAELQSALINLAVNARDAMPNGGTLTIQTATAAFESDVRQAGCELKRGTYVMIAISDSGCGISKDNLDRVFEPFFTTKDVGKGTGLGLSMVYGFVKQSGGQIAIYSEVGVGTTVRLYFPALDHPVVSTTIEVPGGNIDIGGTRILVVEDNEDVLESVTAILEHFACEVVVAGDGPSALEILDHRTDIDVLFTDIVMPGGMTGFELAERARQIHPTLKILYTSGYAQTALKAGERLLPGTELLHKPYERKQLGLKISTLLNRGKNALCTTEMTAA
jgi:signal transduction histidine kinase